MHFIGAHARREAGKRQHPLVFVVLKEQAGDFEGVRIVEARTEPGHGGVFSLPGRERAIRLDVQLSGHGLELQRIPPAKLLGGGESEVRMAALRELARDHHEEVVVDAGVRKRADGGGHVAGRRTVERVHHLSRHVLAPRGDRDRRMIRIEERGGIAPALLAPQHGGVADARPGVGISLDERPAELLGLACASEALEERDGALDDHFAPDADLRLDHRPRFGVAALALQRVGEARGVVRVLDVHVGMPVGPPPRRALLRPPVAARVHDTGPRRKELVVVAVAEERVEGAVGRLGVSGVGEELRRDGAIGRRNVRTHGELAQRRQVAGEIREKRDLPRLGDVRRGLQRAADVEIAPQRIGDHLRGHPAGLQALRGTRVEQRDHVELRVAVRHVPAVHAREGDEALRAKTGADVRQREQLLRRRLLTVSEHRRDDHAHRRAHVMAGLGVGLAEPCNEPLRPRLGPEVVGLEAELRFQRRVVRGIEECPHDGGVDERRRGLRGVAADGRLVRGGERSGIFGGVQLPGHLPRQLDLLRGGLLRSGDDVGKLAGRMGEPSLRLVSERVREQRRLLRCESRGGGARHREQRERACADGVAELEPVAADLRFEIDRGARGALDRGAVGELSERCRPRREHRETVAKRRDQRQAAGVEAVAADAPLVVLEIDVDARGAPALQRVNVADREEHAPVRQQPVNRIDGRRGFGNGKLAQAFGRAAVIDDRRARAGLMTAGESQHHEHQQAAHALNYALHRNMNALPLILFFLACIAIGYRYYSAFLAAKVMALDDARPTPAHRFNDGQNYVPTNKWVLFGHHFAAISGAGPLIGPVLAAQFGYLPGLLWLAFGVVFAGATHDFVILASSVRRNGKSLAAIARSEISPLASFMAMLAMLFVVVIALAGLGLAVVNALAESPWGTFTIFLTIPIALVVGLYLHKSHATNGIRNGSIFGALAVLAAVIVGHAIPGSPLAAMFTLTKPQITYAIAAYGFIASVLPVWMLLCPRDYLSSYMKP